MKELVPLEIFSWAQKEMKRRKKKSQGDRKINEKVHL